MDTGLTNNKSMDGRSHKNRSSKTSLPFVELNPKFNEKSLKSQLSDAFKTNKAFSGEGVTQYNVPFQCCQLKNFLCQDDFMQHLKDELSNLTFSQKDNDLYTFNQSDDLKNTNSPYIASLRSFLYGALRDWMQDVTGLELNTTVDMSCACYDYTDVLLCHDDRLEGRRIAYILYLVPPWTERDGGALDLIDSDENGEPSKVVNSIYPEWNSFVFFKVCSTSYHQVAEVLTEDKTRLSISGWFYGTSEQWPSKDARPLPALTSPIFVEEDVFYKWVNPQYLDLETQMQIRIKFEVESEVELIDFLNEDKFGEISTALQSENLDWTTEGPLNKRHFETLKEEMLPAVVKECLHVFHSEAMFLTLSHLTGLRLHELAEQNSDSSDDESYDSDEPRTKKNKSEKEEEKSKEINAKCYSEVRQFKHGSYTLLHDEDADVMDYVLDVMMFFNCNAWKEEYGGYVSYLEAGDNEELLRVCPRENSLVLVFRDKKTHRFVKHINHRVIHSGGSTKFQVIWSICHE